MTEILSGAVEAALLVGFGLALILGAYRFGGLCAPESRTWGGRGKGPSRVGLWVLFAVLALWVSCELVGRSVVEGPLAVCAADYDRRSVVLSETEEEGASEKAIDDERAVVVAEFARCKRRARDEGWRYALASMLILCSAAVTGWRREGRAARQPRHQPGP